MLDLAPKLYVWGRFFSCPTSKPELQVSLCSRRKNWMNQLRHECRITENCCCLCKVFGKIFKRWHDVRCHFKLIVNKFSSHPSVMASFHPSWPIKTQQVCQADVKFLFALMTPLGVILAFRLISHKRRPQLFFTKIRKLTKNFVELLTNRERLILNTCFRPQLFLCVPGLLHEFIILK